MSDVVIKVKGLGKRYRLGQYVGGAYQYRALRDVLTDAMYAPFHRLRARIKRRAVGSNPTTMSHQLSADFIWALKDVSFDVKQGEVVGIIGRNGAGKSTLLKLLSRITEPTEGRAEIRGRIGSLLEVGTGFHPELTGRENIYLSGAILGMTRKEIDQKFDEIVDFSGIEKFIDTPVKRYSSGMLVRLGFAVAAHLEPEILLVDEVLAVGDAAFQKKCLGKMEDVTKEGRTVLFVSHNMAVIRALCRSGIYLDKGMIRYLGDIATTVSAYLNADKTKTGPYFELGENPSLPIQLLSITVVNEKKQLAVQHPYDQPFWIKIRVLVRSRISRVYLAAHIHNSDLDTLIFTRDFESDENNLLQREPGLYTYLIQVPAPLLVPGIYRLSVHVVRFRQIISGADHVCPFEIIDSGSIRARMGHRWIGKIHIPLKWECDSSVQPVQTGRPR